MDIMYAAVDSRNVSILNSISLTVWAVRLKNITLTPSFRNNSKSERTRSYCSFIVRENWSHRKNTRDIKKQRSSPKRSKFSVVQLDQNSLIPQRTELLPWNAFSSSHCVYWGFNYIWKQAWIHSLEIMVCTTNLFLKVRFSLSSANSLIFLQGTVSILNLACEFSYCFVFPFLPWCKLCSNCK